MSRGHQWHAGSRSQPYTYKARPHLLRGQVVHVVAQLLGGEGLGLACAAQGQQVQRHRCECRPRACNPPKVRISGFSTLID